MIRKILPLLAVTLLGIAAFAQSGGLRPISQLPHEGGLRPITPSTVEPDTQTWAWINSFDTATELGTHASGMLPAPADIDSIVFESDGSTYKYGNLDSATPTTLIYQNSALRQYMVYREPDFPRVPMRIGFYYFSLEDIPSGSQILSAELTAKVTIGGQTFDALQQVVAVIDTSSADFDNYVAGPQRTGPTNNHYHAPAWDYADQTNSTAWAFDFDSDLSGIQGFDMLGWRATIRPPKDAAVSNFFQYDMKAIVQKYVSAGLEEKLIWTFGEGKHDNHYIHIGPNAATAASVQPVLTVTWTNQRQIDGVKFAIFSDNHSNGYAVEMMGDAMDGAGFSPEFLFHNGDMNEAGFYAATDRAIADQDSLAAYWKEIAIGFVVGNHEIDNSSGGAAYMSETLIPGANQAFVDSLLDRGGMIQNFGDKDTFEMKFRNMSWDLGGVHFVAMDFENRFSGTDSVTVQDIHWLENDLASSGLATKIFFTHRSLYNNPDDDYPESTPGEAFDPPLNWAALLTTLQDGGVKAGFTGHTHLAWGSVESGISWFNSPTSGDFPTQARAGFFTVEIDESGSGTVKLYRGYNSDNAYTLSETYTF